MGDGSGGGENVLFEHMACHGRWCTSIGDSASIVETVGEEGLKSLVFSNSVL